MTGQAIRLNTKSWAEASATPAFPLGYIFHEPASQSVTTADSYTGQRPPDNSGERFWRYIRNTSNGAYAAGNIIARVDGAKTWGETTGGDTATTRYQAAGVAQWAIADDYYSFVLCKGRGAVLGTFSADTPIMPAASAAAEDFSDGNEDCIIGQALEAASGALGECDIDCMAAS